MSVGSSNSVAQLAMFNNRLSDDVHLHSNRSSAEVRQRMSGNSDIQMNPYYFQTLTFPQEQFPGTPMQPGPTLAQCPLGGSRHSSVFKQLNFPPQQQVQQNMFGSMRESSGGHTSFNRLGLSQGTGTSSATRQSQKVGSGTTSPSFANKS